MHRILGLRKNQNYTIELISFFIILFGLFTICWPAFAQISLSKIHREAFLIDPEHAFIPAGFDSNDNVQIILNGTLPNPCYKIRNIETTLNQNKNRVDIKIIGAHTVGDICITVLTEYTQVVNLGKINAGKYKLRITGRKSNLKQSFYISEATTTNQDNYQYAQISKLEVLNTDYQNHVAEVNISGNFRESCYTLDQVNMHITKENVIEVLPIMKKTSKICQDVMIPFTYTLSTGALKEGKYLVHVRSEKGTSLNKVIEL